MGHAVLGNLDSARSGRRWKVLLFPLALLALVLLLMYVGPLPGLGLMLCVGGVVALPIIAIQAFLSP